MSTFYKKLFTVFFISVLHVFASEDSHFLPNDFEKMEFSGFDNDFAHPIPTNEKNLVNKTSDYSIYVYDGSFYKDYHNPKPLLNPESNIVLNFIPRRSAWAGVFEFIGDDVTPTKSDCTESKFSKYDYLKILNNPEVKTRNDFLSKIPKDSLQKFTFIYDSKSLQRGGVDKLHPRVMRFSVDGKFVMTYTCAHDNPSKDTVEVMYFDDAKRRYNFLHTQFPSNEKNILSAATKAHTVENPKACFACHGGSDPRPNWHEYQAWPGVYGSNDDLLKYNNEKISERDRFDSIDYFEPETLSDYAQLRDSLKNDPCLTTLPWPNSNSQHYDIYPYIEVNKKHNYHFRPNAHFTIASVRTNSLRLARKIEDHPAWSKIKWQALQLTFGCTDQRNEDLLSPELKQIFNAAKKKLEIAENQDLFKLPHHRNLINIGLALGLYSTDWNLEFNSPTEGYVHYHTAQWEQTEFLLSVLFTDATKEEPELKPYDIRYNRMSNLFGKNFMCMDKVADKIWLSTNGKQKICEILNAKAKAELDSNKAIRLDLRDSTRETRNGQTRSPISDISIKNGKSIAKNLCGQCHNGEVLKLNFLNEKNIRNTLFSNNSKLRTLVKAYLGTESKCFMPMSTAGPCLNEKENKSLLLYIDSLKN